MPPQPQQTREQFIEGLFKLEKPDNFNSDKEARKKLIAGIKKGYNVLKDAYGPNGSDVVIRTDLYPYNETTNDGKKILDAIQLSDPYEVSGLDYMREVANETDKESGDGRKTSAIGFAGIVIEGEKVDSELCKLRTSLQECLPIIIKSIDDQTKQVAIKDISKVAETASESKELGKIFQEIYTKIGRDGIIELDTTPLSKSYFELTNGVRMLGCKWIERYMTNDEERKVATFNNPFVLVTTERILSSKSLNNIFIQIARAGTNEIVILCEDIEAQALQDLAFMHIGINDKGQQIPVFRSLIIKVPTLWKDWIYEDFAKLTGATVVSAKEGKTLGNFQFSWLGQCDKIITDSKETRIIGSKDISVHIEALRNNTDDDSKLRLTRLQTKTAILKLGAESDTELSRLRGKALDGRNSAYLALQGGVVEGAGLSLVKAAKELPDTIGGKILKKALLYPNNILGDKKTDVLDASIVLKTAVTHALSVGMTVLTTNTVILKK